MWYRSVLAFLLMALAGPVAAVQCRDDRVQIRGSWGQTGFTVEVADTPHKRSRGLMYRDSLPRGAGMLFVYDAPQRTSFWMKNTLIPLDMLFVDRAGRVLRVHDSALPGDLTPVEGGDGVYAVLEINGGLARRYGIGPGSELRHPAFAGTGAAWPC